MTEPKPSKIHVHYIKSPDWRVLHVDGVYGGITPAKYLHMAFFSERGAIPQRETYAVTSEGKLGDKEEGDTVTKDGFVRELHVDTVMTLPLARAVHSWLGNQIAALEKVTQAR